MSSTNSRKSRQALAKDLSKQAVPKIGKEEPPQPPENLETRVALLERRLQELADASQQNTTVFLSGFESVDKRMYTLMRIVSEMYFRPGTIHLKTEREVLRDEETGEPYVHGGLNVDWMAYFGEFHAMMALVALVESVQAQPAEEVPDNVIEFGGKDA
jgi:hypothetical protein